MSVNTFRQIEVFIIQFLATRAVAHNPFNGSLLRKFSNMNFNQNIASLSSEKKRKRNDNELDSLVHGQT